MKMTDKNLADVAVQRHGSELAFALEDVGLENMETVLKLNGELRPAVVHASVSLSDREARGIHMSRLFKIVTKMVEQEFSWTWMNECLNEMLKSHAGLSDAATLSVRFELPVLRAALRSSEQGWRTYPVTYILSERRQQRVAKLRAQVLYSSTCPCSASLSQQALRDSFMHQFREERVSREQIVAWLSSADSMVAVAHAQRSEANCEFVFDRGAEVSPLELIDLMEQALGTPVQTAVKREDEQEFARLNARHLMFCEDAARKLKAALLKRPELADFHVEVRHFESLHPHDVVARVSKT